MSGAFTLDLTKFKTKVGVKATAVVRRVAYDAFNGTVRKTPVDTGRARANWIPGIGTMPTGVVGAFTQDTSMQAIKDVVSKVVAGESIFLANNLPYIVPLENGHSQQAPSGMVHLTMLEIVTKFDAIAAGVVGEGS